MTKCFLVVIACVMCFVTLSGCSPDTEPVVNMDANKEPMMNFDEMTREITFPEIAEYELLRDEAEFISKLNDFGLNWEISPRQADNRLRAREDLQSYFITCSDGLITGWFQLSTGSLARAMGSEKNLYLAFFLGRDPTEDDIDRLLQTGGLLTADEWNAFWGLSGILLEKEEDVAKIAERAIAFIEGYGRTIEPRTELAMPQSYNLEGMEGTVSYNFQLNKIPVAELYWFVFELATELD